MRRTSLWILALAVVAGACSDDGGPKVYKPEELRVAVVSGDGQTAQVASSVDASTSISTAALLQSAPGLEVLDRPLVVQLVTEGGQRVMGGSVPPGMKAAWIVEDSGCGRPFHGDTEFDSEGRAENLWVRGTKAGVECEMYAGRIVGGQAVIDSVFVAEFEPGPVHAFQLHHTDGEDVIVPNIVNPGDQYDMRRTVQQARDRHGNLIPSDRVHSLPDSEVAWSIVATDTTTGTGWTITVPPADTTGAHCQRHPPNQYSPNPPLECWSTVDLTLQGAKGSSNVRLRTVHP